MANQHTKKAELVAAQRAWSKKKPPAVARGAAKATRAAPASRSAAKDAADRSPLEQLFPNLKFVNMGSGSSLAQLMREIAREGADRPLMAGQPQDLQNHVSDEAYAGSPKSADQELTEIPATIDQLQRALNSLSNTLGMLADRLEPVLKPVDTNSPSCVAAIGANRSTQVGMQLQSCFGQVEHIAYRTYDLLYRLAL